MLTFKFEINLCTIIEVHINIIYVVAIMISCFYATDMSIDTLVVI